LAREIVVENLVVAKSISYSLGLTVAEVTRHYSYLDIVFVALENKTGCTLLVFRFRFLLD
jgi:hypothetical protein